MIASNVWITKTPGLKRSVISGWCLGNELLPLTPASEATRHLRTPQSLLDYYIFITELSFNWRYHVLHFEVLLGRCGTLYSHHLISRPVSPCACALPRVKMFILMIYHQPHPAIRCIPVFVACGGHHKRCQHPVTALCFTTTAGPFKTRRTCRFCGILLE